MKLKVIDDDKTQRTILRLSIVEVILMYIFSVDMVGIFILGIDALFFNRKLECMYNVSGIAFLSLFFPIIIINKIRCRLIDRLESVGGDLKKEYPPLTLYTKEEE